MADFLREVLANITVYFKWRRGPDGVLDLSLDARREILFIGIDSLSRKAS